MAHLTPDGSRVVLTREDLGPSRGPFSVEFPNGDWVEFRLRKVGETLGGPDVVVMEEAGATMVDGLDGQLLFLNAAEEG